MATTTPTLPPAPPGGPRVSGRALEAAAWLALAALLVVAVPLFVRMPLTPDTAFYDLGARSVLRGRTPEQDFVYLATPGMPWALAAIRAALGWSSFAVRVADLLVVAGSVGLLAVWLRRLSLSRAACVGTVALLFAFYLSTSEWCHCQPDVWMLLPALAALHLRRRQLAALSAGDGTARRAASLAVLEGACWGAACLVKPFVVVPGVLAWAVSAALAGRSGSGRWPRVVADAGGLVVGGLLAGAAWQGWLVAHGAWHIYWQDYREFHADYFVPEVGWQHPLLWLLTKMAPWGVLHFVAVPAAFGCLVTVLARALTSRPAPAGARPAGLALLAAFFLGWVYQASYMQPQFNYHLVPAGFLALALLAGCVGSSGRLRLAWIALAAFTALGAFVQPALQPGRLALWGDCWQQDDPPALRDRLSLEPGEMGTTAEDLNRVAEFLRGRQVGNGELTCFHISSLPLYLELDVYPSTRYLMPAAWLKHMRLHRDAIRDAIRARGQRFLVTDVVALGLSPEAARAERPGDPLAPPPLPADPALAKRVEEQLSGWPWTEPVVFRAGRYYVHEVRHGGAGPPAD